MEYYFENKSGTEIPQGVIDKLNKVINLGLTRAGKLSDFEIGVSLVTGDEIRKMNRDYRAVDAVTDVLSFTYGTQWQKVAKDSPMILGDIVICVERAKEQAVEYGHAFEREMAFLTAHGLMHLLGYEHEDEAGEMKMMAEQDAILNELGIVR